MRFRDGTLAVVVAVSALCARPMAGQSFSPGNVGARAEAMGGSGIAVADDATAIVHNPAAIAASGAPELSAGGRARSNDPGDTETREAELAALVAPIRLGRAAAALGLGAFRTLELAPECWAARSSASGGASTYAPAFAIAARPGVLLGLALNVWEGTARVSSSADGLDVRESSDYSGANASFGALLDLRALASVPLRIGVVGRTPFDLEITAKRSERGAVAEWRRTETQTVVEMPWMVGLGIGVEPMTGLLLTLEGEHRGYGGRKVHVAPSFAAPYDLAFADDVDILRAGVEWRVAADRWALPIRAGWRRESALSQVAAGAEAPSDSTIETVSGGAGFEGGGLRFDIALSRSRRNPCAGCSGLSSKRAVVGVSYRFHRLPAPTVPQPQPTQRSGTGSR